MGEVDAQRLGMESDLGAGLGDLTGQQVGRYLVRRQLGSGGVATVYQAYDQVLGHTVALKVLLPNPDTNTQNRFRREALMAGALRHPHIVRILQVSQAAQGGISYIAMDLVEGESLGALLARHGQLRPEESCNLLEPIARALAFAHGHGIVHRDVKPSNILLRTASPGVPYSVQLEALDHPVTPLLSDFGIARFLDAPELTSTGRTVGTPAFMAPEQCTGSREVDARTDIYALGTVLYRCVVGRLPFSGSTTQMLHAHVYDPLTIDAETFGQLPPLIIEILRRCLAKAPDDRYVRADDLAADLAKGASRTRGRNGVAPAGGSTATLTLSSLAPAPRRTATRAEIVLIAASGENRAPPRRGRNYAWAQGISNRCRRRNRCCTGDFGRVGGRGAADRDAGGGCGTLGSAAWSRWRCLAFCFSAASGWVRSHQPTPIVQARRRAWRCWRWRPLSRILR